MSQRAITRIKFNLLILLIVLIFLNASTLFAGLRQAEYIGYRHKGVLFGNTLPNGVRDLGGGLMSDENYGVIRYTKDGNYMLWLERILDWDDDGIPLWEVKDVLKLGKLKKNQKLMLSYSSNCLQFGEKSPDLIVMAEISPRNRNFKVLRSWRAEINKERFEELVPNGIVCK